MGLLEVFEDMDNSTVTHIIGQACAGLIDPEVFRSNLTPEDLADIEAGRVDVEYLRCAAQSMAQRLSRFSPPGSSGRPGDRDNSPGGN